MRSIFKVTTIFLSLLLFSVAFSGCRKGSLDLNLYYPFGAEGSNAFSKVSRFAVRVKGEAIVDKDGEKTVEETEFSSDSESASLPDVQCTRKGVDKKPEMELEIIGYDENQKPKISGRQLFYHTCGEDRKISIFVAPINALSTLTQLKNENVIPGKMEQSRVGHQVVYLPDGRLLISGGGEMTSPGTFPSMYGDTEFFDPETSQFGQGPSLSKERAFHTATKVRNKIFMAGGIEATNGQSGEWISSKVFELFELGADGKLTRSTEGELAEARAFHTATKTPNENYVLLFGGVLRVVGKTATLNTKWEIFSTESGEVIAKGEIPKEFQRAMHKAINLDNGRLLVVGGATIDGQGNFVASKSIFSISFSVGDDKLTFSAGGKLKEARASHTLTALKDGRILVAGGMSGSTPNPFRANGFIKTMELLSAEGQVSSSAPSELKEARAFHSATMMEDGRLLIYGGYSKYTSASVKGKDESVPTPTTHAEVQTWEAGATKPRVIALTARKDRFHHSATLMLNGQVIILGGVSIDFNDLRSKVQQDMYAPLSKGEIFNPGPSPSE